LLEREVNFQQNPTSHHTFKYVAALPSEKLEVQICGNFQKKQYENYVTFDKNWNVSCHYYYTHMAEYCHNSCSGVHLLPANMRMCEDVHTTLQLHWKWWSGQCHAKHTENIASVHNTCLDKIVCYLQKIFNRNRKLKHQVSKLSALKLRVCSKINAFSFAFSFLPDMPKHELLIFARYCSNILKVWWKVLYGCCWKFTSLSSNERIVKIH